jgi:hypothetical protein
MIFYVVYLLKKLYFFAENIENLREEVNEYEAHLSSLYEMEVFHGDETIQGMIEHTTHILEKIKDFEYFYSLFSDGREPEEEEDELDDNPEDQKEEN